MRPWWGHLREHDPEQQGFVVAEVSPAINPLAVGDQDLPLAHRRRLAADLYLHEPRSNRNDPAALLAVPRGLCLTWSKLDEIDPQFGVEATEQCYRVFCAALRLVRSAADAISGGETQRVRFAVAIVSNPELLVLDEPTVAMDVEARREFWVIMRDFAARGRTVLFATHYLEEADANADRAILMAHGRVVADGPTTEIKARVGRRTLRATLPDVEPSWLADLPGVASADRHGDAVILSCTDSDQTIRALLERYPTAKDIEITGGSLEEAFLELTGEPDADQAGAALQ